LIVNPAGQILAEAGESRLVYASVGPNKRDEDAKKGYAHSSYLRMLSRRQPKLYSSITC